MTVKSGSGETIATGELGFGTSGDSECSFPIEVNDVPNSKYYRIEVSHRGELTYSKEELESRNWNVSFSLGD